MVTIAVISRRRIKENKNQANTRHNLLHLLSWRLQFCELNNWKLLRGATQNHVRWKWVTVTSVQHWEFGSFDARALPPGQAGAWVDWIQTLSGECQQIIRGPRHSMFNVSIAQHCDSRTCGGLQIKVSTVRVHLDQVGQTVQLIKIWLYSLLSSWGNALNKLRGKPQSCWHRT